MTKRLTFTFDNGPWPVATGTVLDFLAERSIKATFFVVGDRLADPGSRAHAERAHAEGHWIGNHTLTHGEPLGNDGDHDRVEREIGESQRRLGALAHPRKFFRPNGGGTLGPHLLSAVALNYLVRNRFTTITWNCVPGDWIVPQIDWFPAAMAALETNDWTTIVLHDHAIALRMETLARFHDELVRRNVEIVQDFPSSCIPIEQGHIRGSISEVVTVASLRA